MKKTLLAVSDGNGVDTANFKKWPSLLQALASASLKIKNKSVVGASNEMILMQIAESIESEKLFVEWLITKEFNVKKVYILTALIFLNIAPLHHSPYDKFLYVLGIDMLNKEL